jgi:hypothetical protein
MAANLSDDVRKTDIDSSRPWREEASRTPKLYDHPAAKTKSILWKPRRVRTPLTVNVLFFLIIIISST